MAELADWDVAAANNNSASPDGFPEGMAPSGVNDAAREVMAVLARWFGDTNGALTSAGAANAYTLTLNATITAYAAGQLFCFFANHAATGAATLNVDGVGAKAIKKKHDQAIESGDIEQNQIVIVAYKATEDVFQLLTPTAIENTVDINGGTIDGTTIGASSATTIVGTTIDATTDFTIGGTVITDNTITDDGTLVINATTAVSFSDKNITNVGDIALDSISSDGTTINIATNSADAVFIDSNQKVLIGGFSSSRRTGDVTADVQLESTGDSSSFSAVRNSNDANAPQLVLAKSRAAAIGGTTIVQDNDNLGVLAFAGADGTDLTEVAARIMCDVDGAPAGNQIPGRLEFWTANSSGTLVNRQTIDSSGNVGFGTVSPSRVLHITNANPAIRLEDTAGANPYAELVSNDSGVLTISADAGAGAANSTIAFNIDGSQVAIVDTSGNVGIGVTPEAWAETALQLGGKGCFWTTTAAAAGGTFVVGHNFYNDGSYKRIVNDEVSLYIQSSGQHVWYGDGAAAPDVGFTPTRLLTLNNSGNLGIGLIPTANMDGLSIEAGLVTIKETTTPTADADYGKIYTKSDNKLYFQDGAGTEHEIAYV